MTWTDSKCGAFVYGSYQHCPASGWRSFPLRPAVAAAHGDSCIDKRAVDGRGVEPQSLADPLRAEPGFVKLAGYRNVQGAVLLRMLGAVLFGSEDAKVARVVVGPHVVDVVDMLTGLCIHDDAVFVRLDVLVADPPAESDVAVGADVLPGRRGRWFLIGPQAADRQHRTAVSRRAAGVAAPTLTGSARDDYLAVHAGDVHTLSLQWSCHRTFTSTAAGDAHRVGDYDDRACADPATVRRHDKDGNDLGPLLELNRWYAWAIRPTDAQRATHEAWLASKRGASPAGMPLEALLHRPTAAEQASGALQDQETTA